MTSTKTIGAAALAALMSISPAFAQSSDTATDSDMSMGSMNSTDFGTAMTGTGTFGDMDANADGMLDETEYNEGMFKRYDRDQSGDIDEVEMEDYDRDMGEGGIFGDRS
ncbi:hypothetical protein OCGS_1240 [Oceaniovalibus guishaninsula JLT2003]|uniref:EF-hand domain-containing protein n=1 Tax=Oceaniovalibus guishaninsula JLT2003 TaxID=1231392 RepID=K2HCS7_9RHOB|nr:hypothetical protein [Oceaniovalibus guishaninsula]EKE44402.1 hypothetical protein OCGS_1240 [Oceaniovalibus guishaninsula JLT2003]